MVNNVTDYRITVDTVVNVMQVSGPGMPPAVPEPAQSFMFVAGLALVGGVSLARKKGNVSLQSSNRPPVLVKHAN